MDRPSPFRAARTIRDIGSYLPIDLGGRPYDREEHGRAARRWVERSEAPLPTAVQNAGFFGNNLFDTTLLAIEFAPTFVRLTVDEDDTRDFVGALGGLLERPTPPGPWPVDLLMHEPSCVRVVAYDSSGDLHDVHVENQTSDVVSGVGTLVNEWFFEEDGRLGWVAETWGVASDPSPNTPTLHLLVECPRASAVDRRLAALVTAFGPAVVPLWQDARAEFRKGLGERFFWQPFDLAEYLPGRMAAHGLRQADFR